MGDIIIYSYKQVAQHVALVSGVDENGNVTSVFTMGGYQTIHDAEDLPPGPGPGTAWYNKEAEFSIWHLPSGKY